MYDIVATTGGSEKISPDRLKLLLQNLLAERFRLKVHWETRETSVYALVQDENGPKFKESAGVQEPGINTKKGSGRAEMKGTPGTDVDSCQQPGEPTGPNSAG